jgi:hypothetical protein
MPESIVRQYPMPHSGCMRETIDLAYDETEIHPVMMDDTVEITVFNRGIALFMKRDKQIRHTHRVLRKLDAWGKTDGWHREEPQTRCHGPGGSYRFSLASGSRGLLMSNSTATWVRLRIDGICGGSAGEFLIAVGAGRRRNIDSKPNGATGQSVSVDDPCKETAAFYKTAGSRSSRMPGRCPRPVRRSMARRLTWKPIAAGGIGVWTPGLMS